MNRIYPEGLRTEILEALAKNADCDVSGLGPNNILLTMLATSAGIQEQITKQLARTDVDNSFKRRMLVYTYDCHTMALKAWPIGLDLGAGLWIELRKQQVKCLSNFISGNHADFGVRAQFVLAEEALAIEGLY